MANSTTRTRRTRKAAAVRLTKMNTNPSFKRKRTLGRNKYLSAVRTIATDRGISFNEARTIYTSK